MPPAGFGLPRDRAVLHGGRAPACQLALPPDPSHVLFVPAGDARGLGSRCKDLALLLLSNGIKY